MPSIDFTAVDEAADFSPLPDGQYRCRLDQIEPDRTQYGDEMWKLRFAVEDEPFQGRFIFDNLVFSEKALGRVKLICSRLGLDVSGAVNVTPELLRHRVCLIEVESEEYVDEEGNTKKRNIVPFAGYQRIEDGTANHNAANHNAADATENLSEADLPF